jgi:hypothetical protein
MAKDAFPNPPASSALAESDGAAVADPRIARAEERLAMLRELAELGMALTRELTRRTLEGPESLETPPAAEANSGANPKSAPRALPGPRHDPAESFARLSRAVRLTLALEAKTEGELSALIAGGMNRAAETPSVSGNDDDGGYRILPRDHPSAYRNKIRDSVFDAIDREITDIYPAQDILNALYERLTEGERYDAFVHRPLREAVEAICEDLDLHPDWSRWTGDGWSPSPEHKGPQWSAGWAPTYNPDRKRRLE